MAQIKLNKVFSFLRKHIGCLIFGGCVLVWFLGGLAYQYSCPVFAGIFGEIDQLENVFSPVSALFSALATFGALWAIHQQQRAFTLQQFENNLFKMIEIHRANRETIKITAIIASEHSNGEKETCNVKGTANITKEYVGAEAFRYMFSVYVEIAKSFSLASPKEHNQKYFPNDLEAACVEIASFFDSDDASSENDKEKFKKLEYVFYDYFQHNLTSYYIHLYHTLKYICDNDKIDKKLYMQILRAQLTTFETLLLYYHALAFDDGKKGCDRNISKFQCYIEETALLHYINKELLFDNLSAGEYHSSAFGENPTMRCKNNCENRHQ